MNITRTGIWNGGIVQPFLTLSDNSHWQLLLFHYVDKGNNLFTKQNAADCNDFGLYSRLKWIDDFTYDSKYQFYVVQDGKIHRWTQTSKPTAAAIAGMTVITGNPVNGIAKATNQSQTYLGYNSWWGACGAWTSYTTGGVTGIPGFGTHGVGAMCTQYLAVYARIDTPKVFLQRDNIENCSSIYEF